MKRKGLIYVCSKRSDGTVKKDVIDLLYTDGITGDTAGMEQRGKF